MGQNVPVHLVAEIEVGVDVDDTEVLLHPARLTPRWTGIVTEWSPPIMVKNFPAFTA